MLERWTINQIMMEQLPVSVYWVGKDAEIKYCNDNARKRLEGRKKLEDVFLNYEHIPVKKALSGVPTHRREITWITQDRTYEDITTVMPIKVGSEVESALVLSMSIEDLKTTIAHATGYSSRYSPYSMVGETSEWSLGEYARDAAQLGYKKEHIRITFKDRLEDTPLELLYDNEGSVIRLTKQ